MQNETIVKHLNFGSDARSKIFEGINKLTKAVSSTLGASGQCVILEDNAGNPQITKDGVTVANTVILLDPVENMGSKLLKEAARKTVKEAGDGTTTATVLAQAILDEAQKAIKSESPREIKDSINTGVKKVVAYLEKISKKVTGNKINQVACISANNDVELGNVIADAFKAVDKTGVVMMETNDDPETVVEIVEGIQYNRGLKNNHFITNTKNGSAELINPLILIVESKIDNIRKIQKVLEYIIRELKNKRPLLIIGDADEQVVSSLAMNKVKGNLNVNLIDAPVYGVSKRDTLDDLALLTGATVINEELGDDMDLILAEHLGSCKKVITSTHETIIQLNPEENVEAQDLIKELQEKIKKAKHPGIATQLEKRVARVSAKVAKVRVGANSEVELQEKKDRVEDAICATKAAIKEGIVPGGGIALMNAIKVLNLDNKGEAILAEAIKAPFQTILNNAGITTLPEILEEGEGVDVVTGKKVSMVKSGIIDPLLVTKSALLNAASVAITILSTDCVINNLRANESSR